MSGAKKSERPLGQITRGKTAPNRLRKVDLFTILYARESLTQPIKDCKRAFFVDLGYGREVFTTLESAARYRALNPQLAVLGVEIDPERVQAALPFADELTFFRLGGFNIPLEAGESVRLVRAFNVLRQYEESQVAEAHREMGRGLVAGGLLLEGTSDPFGRVWVCNLVRKTPEEEMRPEGLVFGTNFRLGFDPALFQPVLPKNYIHRMVPGEPIQAFMEAWKRAAARQGSLRAFGLRQWFGAAARDLAGEGYRIETRKAFLDQGLLVWKF